MKRQLLSPILVGALVLGLIIGIGAPLAQAAGPPYPESVLFIQVQGGKVVDYAYPAGYGDFIGGADETSPTVASNLATLEAAATAARLVANAAPVVTTRVDKTATTVTKKTTVPAKYTAIASARIRHGKVGCYAISVGSGSTNAAAKSAAIAPYVGKIVVTSNPTVTKVTSVGGRFTAEATGRIRYGKVGCNWKNAGVASSATAARVASLAPYVGKVVVTHTPAVTKVTSVPGKVTSVTVSSTVSVTATASKGSFNASNTASSTASAVAPTEAQAQSSAVTKAKAAAEQTARAAAIKSVNDSASKAAAAAERASSDYFATTTLGRANLILTDAQKVTAIPDGVYVIIWRGAPIYNLLETSLTSIPNAAALATLLNENTSAAFLIEIDGTILVPAWPAGARVALLSAQPLVGIRAMPAGSFG